MNEQIEIGGHISEPARARIGWHASAVINDGRKVETFPPVWGLTKRAAVRKAQRVLDFEFTYQTGSW